MNPNHRYFPEFVAISFCILSSMLILTFQNDLIYLFCRQDERNQCKVGVVIGSFMVVVALSLVLQAVLRCSESQTK